MSIRRLILPGWQTAPVSGPAGQHFLAVALAVITAGCASNRPTPLVVQTPTGAPLEKNLGDYLTLKLVTYNIWGLPSWLTGARPDEVAIMKRAAAQRNTSIQSLFSRLWA